MSEETVFYILRENDEWTAVPQEEYDPERIYHVKPRDDEWVVEKEWAARPSSVFDKKRPALARGKELAERNDALLVVHKRDGEVQRRIDYREERMAA